MTNKRILALLVMALLIFGLLGCQAATPSQDKGGGAATPAPAADGKTDEPDAPDSGEVVELVWYMGNPGVIPKDQAKVEEALAELSASAIGARMTTKYFDGDQIKVAMNSGEYFDIVFTCEWYNNYAVQAANGLFADITEKVKTVTPELYAFIPETVWKGTQIDGVVYAVPVYKDTAASQYWQFDKALIVDELGLDITKYNSFESIEEVLKAAKEARPDEYPLMLAQNFNAIDSHFDMINRDVAIGLSYDRGDNKVVVTYDTPEMQARLKKLHEWYNAGYINKDAPTIEAAALPKYSAVKTGQGFQGAEAIWSSENGYELVINKWYGPVMSTASIRGALNAVGAASKHVDKSLELLQLINTSRDYRDGLRYGIEGEHFEYVNDGKSVKKLSDGYEPWGFSQGSFFVMTPEAPITAETWDAVKQENDTAAATTDASTIGFSFDIDPVAAEVAATYTIIEKYKKGLFTGASNPDTEIPKLMDEVRSAGMDAIVAECQTQLDAFIAKYGK